MGMKLEAIDPLNLSAICVATVMKVGSGSFHYAAFYKSVGLKSIKMKLFKTRMLLLTRY